MKTKALLKTKALWHYSRSLLVWIGVFFTLLACTSKNTAPTIPPDDLPISKFIVGEWHVISRIDTDSGEDLGIAFPIVKIYDNEISYGETYRAEYHFTEEDMIFVNNLRLTGGETWRLERDKANLIVYQEFQGFKSTIRLERITR